MHTHSTLYTTDRKPECRLHWQGVEEVMYYVHSLIYNGPFLADTYVASSSRLACFALKCISEPSGVFRCLAGTLEEQ